MLSGELLAKTRYISDVLYVPIRTGKTNGHRVIKVVKSGVALKVLKEDEESGHTKVKVIDGGTVGWVKTRYLINEPIAQDRLAAVQGKAAKLTDQVQPLRAKIAELRREVKNLEVENKSLLSKNSGITKQLDHIKKVSASAISIEEEKNRLKSDSEQLQNELTNLTRKNLILQDNSKNEGIKLAIGAVLLGVVFGLFLPYLKPRKKNLSGIKLR